MWRRLFSSPHLKTLTHSYSNPRSAVAGLRSLDLTRHVATQSAGSIKKTVEDVVPIATGHEREEIQAELEGRNILAIDNPEGPFGTKESPAVVSSHYDRRIVGCPGGEGEDEHDVVWFWLEKGKPHECPVCAQYFELEVVGPGGDPYGHH
ncbi:hypothetical protein TSUD_113510 [Trifolium subterraneum]|uniref:Uncharacterized protein n=1 Tax=Trifolium subterraneum TaxID=3900 RepID=A0A2Z6MCN0_TRISU|nr:hypothetical protein TSUD_113510 [Trifolium subterraneum]